MLKADYKFNPENPEVTTDMVDKYNELGYIILRGMLDKEELGQVHKVLDDSQMYKKYGYGLPDGHGTAPRFVIWGHPGNDVTDMVARSEKVVNASEKLLGGGEVYHYHAKLVQKEPTTGGSLLWHQDYGYWYKNGNLFPDLVTAIFAVDKCTTQNGCLQIIPGSQKCGRIEHNMVAGQHQADVERVNAIKDKLSLVDIEMEPGDVIFISGNLLHVSGPNTSSTMRRTMLFTYNLKSNNPVYVHHHPQYTPLVKVPNSAIKECRNYTDFTGKDFLDPSQDKTVNATKDPY